MIYLSYYPLSSLCSFLALTLTLFLSVGFVVRVYENFCQQVSAVNVGFLSWLTSKYNSEIGKSTENATELVSIYCSIWHIYVCVWVRVKFVSKIINNPKYSSVYFVLFVVVVVACIQHSYVSFVYMYMYKYHRRAHCCRFCCLFFVISITIVSTYSNNIYIYYS